MKMRVNVDTASKLKHSRIRRTRKPLLINSEADFEGSAKGDAIAKSNTVASKDTMQSAYVKSESNTCENAIFNLSAKTDTYSTRQLAKRRKNELSNCGTVDFETMLENGCGVKAEQDIAMVAPTDASFPVIACNSVKKLHHLLCENRNQTIGPLDILHDDLLNLPSHVLSRTPLTNRKYKKKGLHVSTSKTSSNKKLNQSLVPMSNLISPKVQRSFDKPLPTLHMEEASSNSASSVLSSSNYSTFKINIEADNVGTVSTSPTTPNYVSSRRKSRGESRILGATAEYNLFPPLLKPKVLPIADLNANYDANMAVAIPTTTDDARGHHTQSKGMLGEKANAMPVKKHIIQPNNWNNNSPKYLPDCELIETEQTLKSPSISFTMHNTHATANSPSTVSIDSAKGSSIMDDTVGIGYSIGDLFWGQIYSYCYWPCMVSPDPEENTIRTQTTAFTKRGTSRKNDYSKDLIVVWIHVRFFANNGQRNWVKRENLLPFNGLESYQEHVKDVRIKYGLSNLKFKRLQPLNSQKILWQMAISEAEAVANIPHSERLEKLLSMSTETRMLQNIKRKRLQSIMWTTDSTSDIGSIYNSTENLLAIDKSSSPSTEKNEKLRQWFMTSINNPQNFLLDLRKLHVEENDKDYRHLYDVLQEFIMSTDSVKFVDCFNEAVRNIWLFRQISSDLISQQQRGDSDMLHQETLVTSSKEVAIKKITSRLRGLTRTGRDGLYSDTTYEVSSEKDFRRFYLIIKDFALGAFNSVPLERSLVMIVRNLWALRVIEKSETSLRILEKFDKDCLGSLMETGTGERTAKRFSNRLRGIVATRTLSKSNSLRCILSSPKGESTTNVQNVVEPRSKKLDTGKIRKPQSQPLEEVIDNIFNLDNKYLFRSLNREVVCMYCLKNDSGLLQVCDGACMGYFHFVCLNTSRMIPIADKKKLIMNGNKRTTTCLSCTQKKPKGCEVCGGVEAVGGVMPIVCNMSGCDKMFHPNCCRYWPQTRIAKLQNTVQSFRCPSHVCHTCVSDDPKRKSQHLGSRRLVKCIKCPATYHADSDCIPAGSQILTTASIVCPRHIDSNGLTATAIPVNVNWCFVCVGGGHLVCCDSCPTAVHATCLNINIDPQEAYICEECESGRMPLYGEVVWAKFNSCRWWPGIILPPPEVPRNIIKKSHTSGEFVVRFFGTHDHGWLPRRRVYLYQEGDSSMQPRKLSGMDRKYALATMEAKTTYDAIKQFKQDKGLSNNDRRGEKLQPQPYVRIKANKAVPPLKLHVNLEKVNACDCLPDSEEPCGPFSNCINRVLYHECSAKLCPAGSRCQNQMFQRGKSPRLAVIYMSERGFGLVTREPIISGQFVIEYVGEIINDDEFRRRIHQRTIDREENFYFLAVEKDYTIDAGEKGNLARFMNHSCEPNCEAQKWSVNGLQRVSLFAIKDIPMNTELTFNYNWNGQLDSGKKTCFCGAIRCAGQIGSKYRDEPAASISEKRPKNDQKLNHKKINKVAKPVKRLQRPKLSTKKLPAVIKVEPDIKKIFFKLSFQTTEDSSVGNKRQRISSGERKQVALDTHQKKN